eukprot:257701_1
MHQTSTTKRLKCLCGNQLQRYASIPNSSACKNCSQWSDIGTDVYVCFGGRNCEFNRVTSTGSQYQVCCECFGNIPLNQTLEQRLSFGLQTTKSIIQQKTQAQEPINVYLYELMHSV